MDIHQLKSTALATKLRRLVPLALLGLLVLPLGFAQREVVVAVTSDPQSLDPHVSATSGTVTAVNHLFDKLVERDPDDMTIVPDLAESWEQVDGTTYVFDLREGVTFHNGEPLTASDVVFTFERMRREDFPNMQRYVLPLIEDVEALDEHTVQIDLVEAYAPFLKRLPSFYIVPEDYLTEVGDEEFAANPIGSGPFELVEWIHGESLTFEANEDYWRGAPEADRVEFRPVPEASTRIAGLLSGDVDIIEQVNLTDIPRLEAADDVQVTAVNDNRIYFYVMNSSEPPLDDVRVRRALTHAVNWEEVLALFDGYAFRVRLPSLENDFGYDTYMEALEDELPSYDPERARELLEEAGYGDGLELSIQAPNGHYPGDAELAQALAGQLQEVGIDANVEVYEWGVYLTDVYRNANAEDLGFFSMGNPLFDPDQLFTVHFAPEESAGYYSDPELTELGQRGRRATDDAERREIYTQMFAHILENVPYLWSHGVQKVYGMRSNIEWMPRPDNRLFMDEVSFSD